MSRIPNRGSAWRVSARLRSLPRGRFTNMAQGHARPIPGSQAEHAASARTDHLPGCRACERVGVRAKRLRPAGRRLFQLPGPLRRSGGLRGALRAGRALPRLELLLSRGPWRRAPMCWLKAQVTARVEDSCCVSGVKGAGVLETQERADRILDRPHRRRLQEPRCRDRSGRRAVRSRLQGRGALPRLDLCAAGLSRRLGALLPEGAHHTAAAQAVLRVGRGALVTPSRRP